jgi:hypothetical protein
MRPVMVFLVMGVIAMVVMTGSARADSSVCSVTKENYLGWDAIKMTNGIVTLHVVPSIGGRVIQFELGGHAYFNIHPKLKGKVVPPAESDFGMEWTNYGGDKIWTAPQGWQSDAEWPGPPDPILDAGPYTAEIIANNANEVAVRLTSQSDSRSGVQIGRTLRIRSGSSTVKVELFMKNISKRQVRWSLWEVTQHDASDPSDPKQYNKDLWAYCPVNPRSMFPRGFNYMFGLVNNPAFTLDESGRFFRAHYRYQVGKVGLDASAGWLAVVDRTTRHAFFESFDFVPNAAYADNASVEFWMQGPGEFINNQEIVNMQGGPEEFPYLMESEIVSPFAKLAPGEEYHFKLAWHAGSTSGPISQVSQIGAVHEPLTIVTSSGQSRAQGKFAVFHEGTAVATFYSAAGARVGVVPLGRVSPLHEFVIDQQLTVPEKAYRVSIHIHDDGNDLGTLTEQIFVE